MATEQSIIVSWKHRSTALTRRLGCAMRLLYCSLMVLERTTESDSNLHLVAVRSARQKQAARMRDLSLSRVNSLCFNHNIELY